MINRNIAEIKVEDFDFTGFVREIARNLARYVEPTYACSYMRPSRIEEDVYVDLFDGVVDLDELEGELVEFDYEDDEPEYTYEEDLLNNDRILYVKFVLDTDLLYASDGYICGDGDTLEEYDYDDVDYGQFCHADNGYIVKSHDGVLTFQRATYGEANPFQCVARVVDNAGDFEQKLVDFIDKYTKK